MPRVNTVEKSRKSPGPCSGCHTEIPAGDAYRWIKPRYGAKRVRCMAVACRFRSSDLTGSDKLSRVYVAQEQLEDALDAWDGLDVEDVKTALTDAASEIREVGEEYQESADNIHNTFSESSTADECEEKASALDSWADEIESAADDLPDAPEAEDVDADDLTEAQIIAVRDDNDTDVELTAACWLVINGKRDGVDATKEEIAEAREAIANHINSDTDREPTEEQLEAWRDEVRSAASDPCGNCPV